jgi:hypothetical protein
MNVSEQESKKEDEFYDAMEHGYTSDAAGRTCRGEEDGFGRRRGARNDGGEAGRRVAASGEGKRVPTPTPTMPPMEKEDYHLQIRAENEEQRNAVLQMIGATQSAELPAVG